MGFYIWTQTLDGFFLLKLKVYQYVYTCYHQGFLTLTLIELTVTTLGYINDAKINGFPMLRHYESLRFHYALLHNRHEKSRIHSDFNENH
ncbi:hypothetical protein V7654_08725 [Bacillus sp. JJ1609]